MTREYGTVKHPKSGDVYAVQIIDGRIAQAAGPLHHKDPTDTGSIMQAIINNPDANEDGAWLEGEVHA